MKDFFKFNKPKDSYEFQIKEPELPIAPKYNKSENISADLNKNIGEYLGKLKKAK